MKPDQESEPVPSPPSAEKRVGERIKLGSELAAIGRLVGGVELDIARDPTPTEPVSFESVDVTVARGIAQLDAGQSRDLEEAWPELLAKFQAAKK